MGEKQAITPFPISLEWVLSSGAGSLAQTPGVLWLDGHLQIKQCALNYQAMLEDELRASFPF